MAGSFGVMVVCHDYSLYNVSTSGRPLKRHDAGIKIYASYAG